jgi:hypothetical protein
MRDRTYIIIYEVYQAPCRFLNILYIHCSRATRGGGWKPIRVKTNDLITHTDTAHSRKTSLFHFRSFVFWRAYFGRPKIHSVNVVYLSGIWISPVTGSTGTAYVLRNQMCICWQRIFFVFLAVFQFRYWLLTTKRNDGYGVRAYKVAALENVAPCPSVCGPTEIQRAV